MKLFDVFHRFLPRKRVKKIFKFQAFVPRLYEFFEARKTHNKRNVMIIPELQKFYAFSGSANNKFMLAFPPSVCSALK